MTKKKKGPEPPVEIPFTHDWADVYIEVPGSSVEERTATFVQFFDKVEELAKKYGIKNLEWEWREECCCDQCNNVRSLNLEAKAVYAKAQLSLAATILDEHFAEAVAVMREAGSEWAKTQTTNPGCNTMAWIQNMKEATE